MHGALSVCVMVACGRFRGQIGEASAPSESREGRLSTHAHACISVLMHRQRVTGDMAIHDLPRVHGALCECVMVTCGRCRVQIGQASASIESRAGRLGTHAHACISVLMHRQCVTGDMAIQGLPRVHGALCECVMVTCGRFRVQIGQASASSESRAGHLGTHIQA